MGLFSKLKANMNHGGVKVHVAAPSSVPSNQIIPVSISITADSPQTIASVKTELVAVAREQGIAMSGGVGVQESRSSAQTIAVAENRETFTISPGETKTVNLELYVNGTAGAGINMGQAGAMGGALQAIASLAQNFEHINYTYTVRASVDVQGISLDPSDKQAIQILPPVEAVPIAAPIPTVTTSVQAVASPALPVVPFIPTTQTPAEDPASTQQL